VFQADGRMMAVLCDGRTALPAGEPRQFMSYAATTRSTAKRFRTRVDASSDASRVGGDQIRQRRFENGLMVLAPPRRLYAGDHAAPGAGLGADRGLKQPERAGLGSAFGNHCARSSSFPEAKESSNGAKHEPKPFGNPGGSHHHPSAEGVTGHGVRMCW